VTAVSAARASRLTAVALLTLMVLAACSLDVHVIPG
jgi:hypothetical protein